MCAASAAQRPIIADLLLGDIDDLALRKPDADRSVRRRAPRVVVAGDRDDRAHRTVCQRDVRPDRHFARIHADNTFARSRQMGCLKTNYLVTPRARTPLGANRF